MSKIRSEWKDQKNGVLDKSRYPKQITKFQLWKLEEAKKKKRAATCKSKWGLKGLKDISKTLGTKKKREP